MARKATTLKKQTFRITEPDATRVLLVGDFTDWQQQGIPLSSLTGARSGYLIGPALRNATELCLFLVCLGLVNELRRLEAALKRGQLTRRDLSYKAHVVLAQLPHPA